MRHLYLVLIFTQQRFFLLSEEHFYTTVIILGFSFLFYCFLLFCGFALYWAFFFLFNRLSIFLIVLLLEGLNTRSNPSSSKLSVKHKNTHTLTWLSELTRFLLVALSRSCFCCCSCFVKRNGSSRDSGSRSGLPVSFDSSDRFTCSFLVFTLI